MPRRTFIVYFLLLTVGLGLYARSLSNPFVLDDMTKIQWNPDLRDPAPGLSTFVYPYSAQDTAFRNDPSRPLTFALYWVCWHFRGANPWLYHLLNCLLHVGCAGLVYAIARKRSDQGLGAYVASALFLVSPLLAGTVLYAFALSDLLAAFFILAALLNHLRERKSLALEILFFGLALASKQSAIVLPALLIVCDLARGRRDARAILPTAGLAVGYLVFRYFYFGAVGDLEAHGDVYPALTYGLVQGVMIFKYLCLLLSPGGYSIDHFVTPALYPVALQIAAWAGVLALTALLLLWPRLRLLGWGWVFFVICLLPTSSFLPTVDLFVERRAYLPAAGIYLALGALFDRARARFPRRGWQVFLYGSLLFKLVFNASLTVARGEVYSSPQNLWRESLELYPESPRARLNLATALGNSHQYDEARQLLESLLPRQPRNALIYSKLGFIYSQAEYSGRDLNKAWQMYQRSFELDPTDVIALLNASAVLIGGGQGKLAEPLWKSALQLSPNMAYTHFVAGEALAQDGQKPAAVAELRKALQLDPGFGEAQQFLQRLEAAP